MTENTAVANASNPVSQPKPAPRRAKQSARGPAVHEVSSEGSAPAPSVSSVTPAVMEQTEMASPLTSAPSSQPAPKHVIEQLRKRLLHPDNTVHYSTRQQQLNTAMRIMDQISRKIGKDDCAQRAMLSGMYELVLVIAERFVLLTHGIMQLDAMNHASALPAIREARTKFRRVAVVQNTRQAQEFLDVPGTLQLLAELSRNSLD